jgi:hypothetical protein
LSLQLLVSNLLEPAAAPDDGWKPNTTCIIVYY